MSLFNDLNPIQQKAVLETEGPLLVFAGAGSGKTRVLTYRIAYLIQEKKVYPSHIFAVTFTNKAADEMRERVERLLGGSTRGAWISTFHSACVRILRQHIEPLGFQRNFVIYDQDDQDRHLKTVMRALDLDFKVFPPAKMRSAIDHLKNQGITPDQYRPAEFNVFQKRVALIYQRYQEDLRRNNALDFGDLLNFVTVLFRKFPEVLNYYQERFHYVLVDEFQDTNLIQYELIRQIAGKRKNVFVVGDDDQSIYRWRGAEIGNILNFQKDFAEANVITLEQNYRSTQNILRAANDMVSRNRLRKAKTLWTENPEGELLTFFTAEDEEDEARCIAQKVIELCRSSSFFTGTQGPPVKSFRDIAVFYRINAQSRALEDELVRNGIPYTIVGGMKFYERREIKDVLAYLKAVANPSDNLSLKRAIHIPSRGIGEKTIEKIEQFSREKGLSLYEGLRRSLSEDWLPGGAKKKIDTFVRSMDEFRREAGSLSLSQLALTILAKTGYLQQLKEERTDEALSRVENIEELINVLMEYEKGEEDASLETFLDKVSLVSDVDLYEDKGNRVSLMTLHCAKGLEFPDVFITGIEDGLLPHHRRGEEIQDLEEERRLFYVGMTRAREKLFLSRAKRRHTFGVGHANLPSRFLDEIPLDLVQFEGKEENWKDLFSYEPSETWAPRYSYSGPTKKKKHTPAGDDYSEAPGWEEDHFSQESPVSSREEVVISPEGFFHMKMGMRVRHPKFGEGRVRSVEGLDENQKVTILFQSVGSKRLKVCLANLEILEG